MNLFTGLFIRFRWEAGQILARKLMLDLVDGLQHNKPLVLNPKFVDGFKRILCDSSVDKVCLGQFSSRLFILFTLFLVFSWGKLYYMIALIGFYAL